MPQIIEKILCYHCGDECNFESVVTDDKHFCCTDCQLVYEILQENNLCGYYALNNNPGIKHPVLIGKRYGFLDDAALHCANSWRKKVNSGTSLLK